EATAASAALDREAGRWRAHGRDDGPGSRRIEREGADDPRLDAGASELARGLPRSGRRRRNADRGRGLIRRRTRGGGRLRFGLRFALRRVAARRVALRSRAVLLRRRAALALAVVGVVEA